MRTFEKQLDAFEEKIWIRRGTRKGIQHNNSLSRAWSGLRGSLRSSADAPSQAQSLRLGQLGERHAALIEEGKTLLEEELAELGVQLPENLRALLEPK